MDSYLHIAKKVLREARQPLSAQQILKAAYQLQIVPRDLFGRTQHKTLHARLSTDILHHRFKSDFYRPAPGRFFLRVFQTDPTIPERYQKEYIAPLRSAQLGRFDVLSLPRKVIGKLAGGVGRLRLGDVNPAKWRYRRLDDTRRNLDILAIRLLVLLLNDGQVLLRQRRPLGEGEMPSRTAVGFEGFVKGEDRSLFSEDEIGLIDAAVRTVAEGLDLAPTVLVQLKPLRRFDDAIVLYEQHIEPSSDDLVVIVSLDCSQTPEVLEATQRPDTYQWQRLPLQVNNLDRFDRWSLRILADTALQREVVC
jgi:hypothetical protein